jgi:hypothetical protein
MDMKFYNKKDKEVSYNFGIYHIHRKHYYDHENITTTKAVLAAKVQCIQNNVSPCSINKRAHGRVILVAPTLLP